MSQSNKDYKKLLEENANANVAQILTSMLDEWPEDVDLKIQHAYCSQIFAEIERINAASTKKIINQTAINNVRETLKKPFSSYKDFLVFKKNFNGMDINTYIPYGSELQNFKNNVNEKLNNIIHRQPFTVFFEGNKNLILTTSPQLSEQLSEIDKWNYQGTMSAVGQNEKLTRAMITLQDEINIGKKSAGFVRSLKDLLPRRPDLNGLMKLYPFVNLYQQLKSYLNKVETSNTDLVTELWDRLDAIAADGEKYPSEDDKLKRMQQDVLDIYYKVRKTERFSHSKLADALEEFITHKNGLNIPVLYHIDIPHTVKKNEKPPELDKWLKTIRPDQDSIRFMEIAARDLNNNVSKDIRKNFYAHFKKSFDFENEYLFMKILLEDIETDNINQAFADIRTDKTNNPDFSKFLQSVHKKLEAAYPLEAIYNEITIYKEYKDTRNIENIKKIFNHLDINKKNNATAVLEIISRTYPARIDMPPFLKNIQQKLEMKHDPHKKIIHEQFDSYIHPGFLKGQRSFSEKKSINEIRDNIMNILDRHNGDLSESRGEIKVAIDEYKNTLNVNSSLLKPIEAIEVKLGLKPLKNAVIERTTSISSSGKI